MSRTGRPISLVSKQPAGATESEALDVWALEASRLIKQALLERGWGYRELAEALRSQGIGRSVAVINRRINRGNFSAGFFLACLQAMGGELEVRGLDSCRDL